MPEVVVVGGGQAGLAIGYYLVRQGCEFTILEASAEPAASWRGRWDSLTLFTSARYDGLPGLPFPGDPARYPQRDDVVDYLTDYAHKFELPVELNSRVHIVRRNGDRYVVGLADRTLDAGQVVIATGPFQVPFVPAIADGLASDVIQMHSTEYRNPDQVPAGPLLVVGGGNTGYQIAAELAGSHDVHLSIGTPQTPLPQRIFGRDLFWYLDATGLIRKTRTSRIGQRMRKREDTLIGSSPRTIRRDGVELRGRTIDVAGSTARFSDDTTLDFASIIWATGFRLDHSWIDVPVFDDSGQVVHERGVTQSPGLYFLGLLWQHTRGSALLGWVKDDAEYLAGQVAAYQAARPTAGPPSLPPAVAARPTH